MSGKGGGGAVSTNDQLVQMQQEQAQQAALSAADTNARLQQGVKQITGMFEGVPSGSSMLDLSSIANASPYTGGLPSANAPPNLPSLAPAPAPTFAPATTPSGAVSRTPTPATRTAANAALSGGPAYTPAPTATAAASQVTPASRAAANAIYAGGLGGGSSYGGRLANGYTWGVLGDTGGGTPMYGIWDAGGNLVTDASSLSDLANARIYTGGDPNQKTGGFGNDFYSNYENSILGYYLPQEGQQYDKARTQLNYNLSRAGQLNSSVAGMDIGDLANQDAINRAQIASSADQQTGALRTQVAQNEQTALNQLYSTENPSVAANTAQNLVANAQLTKPLLNPAGQLFNVASVGVGNAISGFTNPYAYINPGAGGMGQLTTPGGGSTAGGATGTGSTVSG